MNSTLLCTMLKVPLTEDTACYLTCGHAYHKALWNEYGVNLSKFKCQFAGCSKGNEFAKLGTKSSAINYSGVVDVDPEDTEEEFEQEEEEEEEDSNSDDDVVEIVDPELIARLKNQKKQNSREIPILPFDFGSNSVRDQPREESQVKKIRKCTKCNRPMKGNHIMAEKWIKGLGYSNFLRCKYKKQ